MLVSFIFTLVGFVIGTFLGSLVKALADRCLTNQTFWGRSSCPNCQHQLAAVDLIPLLSYLLLQGKCRYCHKKIGIDYLLVEGIVGFLIGLLFWQSISSLSADYSFANINDYYRFLVFVADLIFKIFFISVLSVVFITDYQQMFIPDRIIKPALKIGLVYLLVLTIIKVSYLYYYLSLTPLGRLLLPPHSDFYFRHALYGSWPLIGSLLMATALAGFFLFLIMITKGKGMGGGDVKLGAFMGLGLGFPSSLLALMIAFLSGAVVSLWLVVFGKKRFGQTIAFGPFLVVGSLIALFWGERIVDWYLHIGS